MTDTTGNHILKLGSVEIPVAYGPVVPTVYFELIGSANYIPGLVEVVLITGALMPNADGSASRIAHVSGVLKCNVIAAQALRDALSNAIAIQEKPSDPLQAN